MNEDNVLIIKIPDMIKKYHGKELESLAKIIRYIKQMESSKRYYGELLDITIERVQRLYQDKEWDEENILGYIKSDNCMNMARIKTMNELIEKYLFMDDCCYHDDNIRSSLEYHAESLFKGETSPLSWWLEKSYIHHKCPHLESPSFFSHE